MPKLFEEERLYYQSANGRILPTYSKCCNDVDAGYEEFGLMKSGRILSFSQSGRHIYDHNTWRKFGLFE